MGNVVSVLLLVFSQVLKRGGAGGFVIPALLVLMFSVPHVALAQEVHCREVADARSFRELLDSDLTATEVRHRLRKKGALGQEIVDYQDFLLGIDERIAEASLVYLRDLKTNGLVNLTRIKLALLMTDLVSADDQKLYLNRYNMVRKLEQHVCEGERQDLLSIVSTFRFHQLSRENNAPPSQEHLSAARKLALTQFQADGFELYSRLLSEANSAVQAKEFEELFLLTGDDSCRASRLSDCLNSFSAFTQKNRLKMSSEAQIGNAVCQLKLIQYGRLLDATVCEPELPKSSN